MSIASFVAGQDDFVTYVAVGTGDHDVHNLYAAIFQRQSYPWTAVRCFYLDGWHPLTTRDDPFFRKWQEGAIDESQVIEEEEARRVVGNWGFCLNDGLGLLARAEWRSLYAATAGDDQREAAGAFIARYGFPLRIDELLTAG